MYEALLELLPEALAIAFFSVGSLALSSLGLYLERLGVETAIGGHPVFALWFVVLGGMALYFGAYLMGYTELLPRLRALAGENSSR